MRDTFGPDLLLLILFLSFLRFGAWLGELLEAREDAETEVCARP